MDDVAAAGEQITGDDPQMTTPPHRFGVPDRASALVRQPKQFAEPRLEIRAECIIGIIVEAGIAPSAFVSGGTPRERPRRPPSWAIRT